MALNYQENNLIFTSDAMGTLTNRPSLAVSVSPDQIQWSYRLNVATYPTYGGEVVQILSMVFDDLQVTGQVQSYAQLEDIYSWFATYMQMVSQHGNFQDSPVTMQYAPRDWQFSFWPTEMPGFKYGRDVVGPTWQIKGVIHESDYDTYQSILDQGTTLIPVDQFNKRDLVNNVVFGTATADVGYNPNNPFSGPTGDKFSLTAADQDLKQVADWWHNLVPAYRKGRFPNLNPPFSRPVIGDGPPLTGKKPASVPDPSAITGSIGDLTTKFFPQQTP